MTIYELWKRVIWLKTECQLHAFFSISHSNICWLRRNRSWIRNLLGLAEFLPRFYSFRLYVCTLYMYRHSIYWGSDSEILCAEYSIELRICWHFHINNIEQHSYTYTATPPSTWMISVWYFKWNHEHGTPMGVRYPWTRMDPKWRK